ncbi:MAG TPA: hypothetical protein VEY91_06040 [Candidatus Limnocylindria bacterium]|nr:hypothetical protein [Candidatus Limnocylindria bacterium]
MKSRPERESAAPGPPFSKLARSAIEKHVPEVRSSEAWWSLANNNVWVRWPAGDVFAYLALHRHLDWISGEAGISREPHEIGELFPLPGVPAALVPGYRIRLGHLLDGDDRWWATGEGESELIERLEWLVLQLRVKGAAYFRRYPPPASTTENETAGSAGLRSPDKPRSH